MPLKNSESGSAPAGATLPRVPRANRSQPSCADSKPPIPERTLYRTDIGLFAAGRSPTEISHLANLLENAINPLISLLTGGTLDLSGQSAPEEAPLLGCAAFIFKGVLTSDQVIVMPNRARWWWVQNAMEGAFTLKFRTPSGALSGAIPQNSAWQLIQCDGNNNIVLSAPHIRPTGACAREWFGTDQERAMTEIFRVACVPTDRIDDELRLQVSHAAESALLGNRIRILKRRNEMKRPFRRIVHLKSQLLKALDELDDEVFQASGVDRVSVTAPLTALLDVPLRYLGTSRPKTRVSNRPRGSTANPVLRRLSLNLYISIVEGAQGKLTLYGGKGEAKGTLPAVLEILRPHLPEIIPAKLPYETLRDIRKSAREAQERRSIK
jgi:hypothetical protein